MPAIEISHIKSVKEEENAKPKLSARYSGTNKQKSPFLFPTAYFHVPLLSGCKSNE
jgi:hypothetical protein